MNKGVFYREKEKMLVMPFKELQVEIPFSKLKNALVTKEHTGYFTITKVKEKNVNPKELIIIQNGEKLESPFSISTVRIKDLFEMEETKFTPLDDSLKPEPSYDEFEKALLEIGFYRADKTFFLRGVRVENYEVQMKKK